MVGVGVLSCVPLRNSDWMLDVGCWMLNQIVHVVLLLLLLLLLLTTIAPTYIPTITTITRNKQTLVSTQLNSLTSHESRIKT